MAGTSSKRRSRPTASPGEARSEEAEQYDDTASAASPPRQRQRTNPFLLPARGTFAEEEDVLLRHVLTFTKRNSSSRPKSAIGSTDRSADCRGEAANPEIKEEEFRQAIAFMTAYVESSLQPTDRPTRAFTRKEIATLLLPWGIHQISHRKDDDDLHTNRSRSSSSSTVRADFDEEHLTLGWKATASSLLLLTQDGTASNHVDKILSQSVLFKLVPKVAILAARSEVASEFVSEDNIVRKDAVATTFRLLLDRFTPTMEVAIKSVLLQLLLSVSLDSSSTLGATPTAATASTTASGQYSHTLAATLRWIHTIHLSRKGNPKTTFQLLCEPSVFVALCRCHQSLPSSSTLTASAKNGATTLATSPSRDVVRDILWDGLFHYQHHMEGFVTLLSKKTNESKVHRARGKQAAASIDNGEPEPTLNGPLSNTKPTSTFKSYHEALPHCISYCLSDWSLDKRELIEMLPVLLRGFFHHSAQWDRQQREAAAAKRQSRKPSSDVLAPLQFELFRQWSAPLLDDDRWDGACQRLALRSLRLMLELVLEFDSYTPSQKDLEGGGEYSYLQSISSWVLEPTRVESLDDEDNVPVSASNGRHADSIRCLSLLVKLHHLLVHDQLVAALLLCMQKHNDEDNDTGLVRIEFMTILVVVYRRLRQQSYIVEAMLRAVSKSKEALAWNEIATLHSLLADSNLSRSFAMAIESSPIHEILQVFDKMTSWINELCQSNRAGDDGGLGKCLALAVRLCTLVTRNVRVDRGTSVDIAKACQGFIQGPVVTLSEFNSSTNSDSSAAAAVGFCGLFSELHTRCAFWLGRNQALGELPPAVKEIQKAAVNGSLSAPSTALIDGLVFLCSLRLKLLHSMIYDHEHEEMEVKSDQNRKTELLNEASELATFVAAEDMGRQKGEQWTAVAQNLSSWMPYASSRDVLRFLKWVVSTASASSATTCISTTSNSTTATESQNEQVEIAKCLVADASFYQHEVVSTKVAFAGLCIVLEETIEAIGESSRGGYLVDLKIILVASRKDADWICSHKKEMYKLISECSMIETGADGADSIRRLQNAHRAMLVTNGLRCSSPDQDAAVKMLDLVLRLDHACRSLCMASRAVLSTVTPIISELRLSVANMLAGEYADALRARICTPVKTGEFVCGVMKSAIHFASQFDTAQSTAIEVQQLLFATGQVVKQLVSPPFVTSLDVETAENLSKSYQRMKAEFVLVREIDSLAFLSRFLLDGLQYDNWYTIFPHETDITAHLAKLLKSVLDLAQSSFLDTKSGDIDTASSSPALSMNKSSGTGGALLLGDLICVQTVDWLSMREGVSIMDDIQRSCIEVLSASKTRPMTCGNVDAAVYLIGRIAFIRPSIDLLDVAVDLYTAAPPHSDTACVLEAILCHSASLLRDLDLNMTLTRLTTNTGTSIDDGPESSAGPKLRLVKLLLRYLQDEEQIQVLASNGRKILFYTLQSMRRGPNNALLSSEDALAAVKLVEDLIKRHDVLPLKERDLALILSHIVGVLGRVSDQDGVAADAVSSNNLTTLYVGAGDVFTTMFQRYTKQLYACVPSVVLALQCFLRHAIYAPLLSDQEVTLLGQRFTRLCELLVGHKEIYKKHVIGLVLEFVGALGQSSTVLTLHRRDSLVPAVYCLLDTMSKFEMQQLNAYMDSKAKIQFRSIHQSYEKLHTYKGQ